MTDAPGSPSGADAPPAPSPVVPIVDERVACPACGERIPGFAAQCRHCQEFLLPASRARELAELRASLLLGVVSGCGLLLLLLLVSGVAAAVAHPALARMRRRHNEREAVAALRAIVSAQARHRSEAAPVADGAYADMSALARAQLVDRELATGIKDGYQFTVVACDLAPGERWIAIATPKDPGRSGDRHFAVNHTGAVYSLGRPFPLDTQRCELPPDAVPLGEGEWE